MYLAMILGVLAAVLVGGTFEGATGIERSGTAVAMLVAVSLAVAIMVMA